MMPDQINVEGADGSLPSHTKIASNDQHPVHTNDQPSQGLRDSNGWDGKLRVQNPEALSDSEYSDPEHVLQGDQIKADEGIDYYLVYILSYYMGRFLTFPSLIDLLDDEDPDTDEINLVQSRIASIPSLRLERFKKVVKLCLRQNRLQTIEGLSLLAPTLQDLDLYDNLISHIRGLEELTELTSLDLSYNKIKHIKNIEHLTKLTDLYFVSNKISRIEGLNTLVNLRQLELASNRIREIQNLDSFPNLEELFLGRNKITELHGLGGLPKLRLLSVQSNRITDLSPLREVPQLEELYISHNAIESLEGLEGNVNLTTIDISNNLVQTLKGLGGLKKLEEFWASSNNISDIAEVERELSGKTELKTVYFEGNPLQKRQPALYRNKVRLALPQVQQIDACKLSPVSWVPGTP
jgi:protein phosphatase 1 regulatory subunit 7